MIALGEYATSSRADATACSRPTSSSGGSAWPWKRCSTFQRVRPCRHNRTRRGVGPCSDTSGFLAPGDHSLPAWAGSDWSTNGIVGQSFHSRSRA